jgi:hypothetical protein
MAALYKYHYESFLVPPIAARWYHNTKISWKMFLVPHSSTRCLYASRIANLAISSTKTPPVRNTRHQLAGIRIFLQNHIFFRIKSMV